jgi:glyoxylase-like metal-dependent hydrolase (beta-lactamase superfamily II)
MIFRQLFDPGTSTYSYLLADEESRAAVLIDPVREQVERDLALLDELGVSLRYTLETHVHADHVTGGGALREATGCSVVLGHRTNSECADLLVHDGDVIRFGTEALEVRETPGHTDGCVTFVSKDHRMAFTGDALLIRGCGRTDFQQGSARTLYASIHAKIFSLPHDFAIFPGHDYRGHTRSTVDEEKRCNPRLGGNRTVDEFVRIMDDLQLDPPARIEEAVPANMSCGITP